MMSNDRGRGGTGPKKTEKIVPPYGISPQLTGRSPGMPALAPVDPAYIKATGFKDMSRK